MENKCIGVRSKIFVIGNDKEKIQKFKEQMVKNNYQVLSYEDIYLYKLSRFSGDERLMRKTLYGITICDGVTSIADKELTPPADYELTENMIKICNLLGIPFMSMGNWIAYSNNLR